MAIEVSSVLQAANQQVILTSNTQVASASPPDVPKTAIKRAVVHQWFINGQEVDVLFRVYIDEGNGLVYVDAIADQSVAALTSRVAGMTLGAQTSHPSPIKDQGDGSAMTNAGGS